MTALRLSADWVVTMDGAPIRGGAVVVDGTGRVVRVDESGEGDVRQAAPSVSETPNGRPPDRQTVLIPGLVNAHSHLELTGLDGKVTEDDFPAWIAHLVRLWRERPATAYLEAARQGIRDSWSIGVTTIADCGATGSVLQALHELGGSGIAYHEVSVPTPSRLTPPSKRGPSS